MSVLCAVGSRPFLVLPTLALSLLFPAALGCVSAGRFPAWRCFRGARGGRACVFVSVLDGRRGPVSSRLCRVRDAEGLMGEDGTESIVWLFSYSCGSTADTYSCVCLCTPLKVFTYFYV